MCRRSSKQEGRLCCIFHHGEWVGKTRLRSGVNGAVQRGEARQSAVWPHGRSLRRNTNAPNHGAVRLNDEICSRSSLQHAGFLSRWKRNITLALAETHTVPHARHYFDEKTNSMGNASMPAEIAGSGSSVLPTSRRSPFFTPIARSSAGFMSCHRGFDSAPPRVYLCRRDP
jgi:hypothetical protein